MSGFPTRTAPTAATAQWRDLVKEAMEYNGVSLDEELESYLVFLLMRYMKETHLASRVMALEYLQGMQCPTNERNERMREVGDQCLLFSGLYPKQAQRRRVKISYYVKMGRSAYSNLSDLTQSALAVMYSNLADSFVALMDTLLAMRCMNDATMRLEPLLAYELWQDTQSQQARRMLMSSEPTILAMPTKASIRH